MHYPPNNLHHLEVYGHVFQRPRTMCFEVKSDMVGNLTHQRFYLCPNLQV